MQAKNGIAIEGSKLVIPIHFRKSKKHHQSKEQKTLENLKDFEKEKKK